MWRRTAKRAVLGKLLLSALVVTSCAVPRPFIDIPAVSNPQREARYYRTQDAANLAAGVAADQALRVVFPGPTRDHQHEWAPLARLGTVLVLGGVRRQTDRGYREGGWLLNVSGAFLNEWVHFVWNGVIRKRHL